MGKGFTIGAVIGGILSIVVLSALGLESFILLVLITIFVALITGAIGNHIDNIVQDKKSVAIRGTINKISDKKARETIQKIQARAMSMSESEASNLLKDCDKVLALKYVYDKREFFYWIVTSDDLQVVSINAYGTPSIGVPDITIKELELTEQSYHPGKLVYTGATVGGIHTGGFHKEKAYISERSKGSNKYGLYLYITKPDAIPGSDNNKAYVKIDEILVSKTIFDNLHDTIKAYAQEHKLILKHNKVSEENANLMKYATEAQNVMLYSYYSQVCYLDTQLTKGECQTIKSWISAVN